MTASVWVCVNGSRDWGSSECIFLNLRASAHQHKALNIYTDPESLTALPPPPHPSVTPITSSSCASYHLLPSSDPPLHTYTHAQAHQLCFFWFIMRTDQGKPEKLLAWTDTEGRGAMLLLTWEELFRWRQVANLMLFVRPWWHQSATPLLLNSNGFNDLLLFWN